MTSRVLPMLLFLVLSGCAYRHEPSLGERPPVASLAPAPAGDSLGDFRVTYYLVAQEKDHAGKKSATLYDQNCRALATVPKSFAKELALEGTGKLRDGRMLNWAGRCSRGSTFRVLGPSAPWGVGAAGADTNDHP